VDDAYRLTSQEVREPPPGLRARMRYLGPGLILSASIVGSGELITTTLLGAKAGFVCLWVILLSCLVKVAVQVEFGKNAIYSGRTTMEALNRLPGPAWRGGNWVIWIWLGLMLPKMLQVGGIVGGVALVMREAAPWMNPAVMVWPVAVAAALMVWGGGYRLIERVCVVLIALFTVFSVASLVALQFTEHPVAWGDIAAGMSFQLPPEAVLVAFGAFGITGIGGDEIMAYNYWLIEKGYARHAGRAEDSDAWRRRAAAWMRVMKLDALVSMAVYTLVTVVFYLLGAAVLHRQGLVPESEQLVPVLSRLYTDSLGAWAGGMFLAGAFVVLFSTVIAALGAWTRMFADAFAQLGMLDFHAMRQRGRWIAGLAFVIPVCWCCAFLFYRDPAWMVVVGGVATVVILVLVAVAAGWFRYRELPSAFQPGRWYDVWLWLSMGSIALVGVFGLGKALAWF
jgi:manganese transport protein